MRRSLAVVGMMGVLAASALLPVNDVSAQTAFVPTSQDQPLVVIRFNQPRVNYARALRKAVDEALRTSPSIQFHVMAFVPTDANGMVSAMDQEQSGKLVNMVMVDMQRMGVSDYSMTTSQQSSPLVGSHELHIFVY